MSVFGVVAVIEDLLFFVLDLADAALEGFLFWRGGGWPVSEGLSSLKFGASAWLELSFNEILGGGSGWPRTTLMSGPPVREKRFGMVGESLRLG